MEKEALSTAVKSPYFRVRFSTFINETSYPQRTRTSLKGGKFFKTRLFRPEHLYNYPRSRRQEPPISSKLRQHSINIPGRPHIRHGPQAQAAQLPGARVVKTTSCAMMSAI
jgi:hypothetical protein